MTLDEAIELLDDQPIGTYLITAIPAGHRGDGWVASAHTKDFEGWVAKTGVRRGMDERHQSGNVAHILAENDDMNFIWSLS